MAELTHNDVLSLLNRMDAEQRTLEQFTLARQKVREVIAHYQTVCEALPGAEQRLREVQERADGLEARISAEGNKHRAEIERDLNTLRLEQKHEKAVRDAAIAERKASQAELTECCATAEAHKADLAREIEAMEAKLAQTKRAFEEFRVAHGLAG